MSVDTASLPPGWHEVPVRKIASIITGPFGTLLKASEYGGPDGVPLISVGEIRDGFLRVTEETPRVEVEVTNRLPQYLLKEGDIVFGRKGGVERSARVLPEQAGWFLGSDGISVRLRDGLNSAYFGHAMRSKQVQNWLLQNASGTTMPSLNQAILGSVAIRYPDNLPEQQAIAAALSDADGVVAGLERVIAKKRLIKQGAMQDLLTARRRLPGFSGEWEAATLSELADIRSGGTPSTSDATLWDGDIAWVTPTDITALDGRKFLSGTTRTISRAGLRQSSAELLPEGTIVMTSRATIGECAISAIPLTTNQGFKNFIPKDRADRDFLYYLLMSQKKGFIELCSGSTFLEIGKTQLTGYTVRVPETKKEQEAIAAVLSDMDAEIQTLESRLVKARAVKEGMMQNLLTGRVRLV